MLLFLLAALTAGQHAAASDATAPELKSAFVDAFRAADGEALNRAYDALAQAHPEDPELPAFAYEVAVLYGNAAIHHPAEMKEEARRAEELYRLFAPGGPFAGDACAVQAQIQHALFLAWTGEPLAAGMIYRNLARDASDTVFETVTRDVLEQTLITPGDAQFWSATIEERMKTMTDPSPALTRRLALLQAWNEESSRAARINAEAPLRLRQADFQLEAGQYPQGKEKMRQLKELLEEYFALLAEGSVPRPDAHPRIVSRNRYFLAMAEVWLGNDPVALDLLDRTLSESPSPQPEQWQLRNFLARVKFWQILVQDRVQPMPAAEKNARMMALLGEGQCGAWLACKVVEKLARAAEATGDAATAHGYLRDLADVLPDPALALWARKQQAAGERVAPHLAHNPSAPTPIASLFYADQTKAADEQAARIAGGMATGPRAFPNWRQPRYSNTPGVQQDNHPIGE